MSPDEPRKEKNRLLRLRQARAALNVCFAVFLAAAFVWCALLTGQGAPLPGRGAPRQTPSPTAPRLESVAEAHVPLAPGVRASASPKPSSAAAITPSPVPAEDAGVLSACTLAVPSIGLDLQVSEVCTDEALTRSVCKFSGPQPGQKGNYVIAGHDYVSGAQFARLGELRAGNKVVLRDKKNREYTYTVYSLELVTPENVRALDVPADAAEVTLITCASENTMRLLVRCRMD